MSTSTGKHTVYVRAEDAEIWERAETYAKARRIPMSGLIMLALEKYLAAEFGDDAPEGSP